MNAETLWMLKVILGGIAGLFGVLGAFLTVIDTANDDKQENIKRWFKKKWEDISKSSWIVLPEIVITKVLDSVVDSYYRYSNILFSQRARDDLFLYTLGILYFINLIPGKYTQATWIHGLLLVITVTNYDIFGTFPLSYFYRLRSFFFQQYNFLPWPFRILVCFYYAYKLLLFTLKLDLGDASLLLIIITPAYWFLLGVLEITLLNRLSKRSSTKVWLDRITFMAFMIGGGSVVST